MPVASREDIASALRRNLDPELENEKVTDWMLKQLEARLTVRIPDFEPRTTQTDPAYDDHFTTLVRGVEAEAVARVLRAPNNGVYRTESEGDYSYGLNYQVASGLLDILPEEWDRLGAGDGVFGMVAPATDGYLTTRGQHYLPPAARFQTEFGVPSSMSKTYYQ